jgi:hypothetical protein
MKRSKFHVLGILLLVFAGCSSSNAPSPPTQVNYVQGGTYVYYAQNLDKNTGQPTAGTGDTITSVVLQTGISYQGMSNVTEIQNTHTNPVSMDTTYISQSNGSYWHYNYGLELLNENPAVLASNNGNPLIAGWVLQAKFSANMSDTWAAVGTPITFAGQTGELTDTATEASDTTLAISSSSVSAKHSVHALEITSLFVSASGSADTYVSVLDGPVIDIIHPTTIEQMATPGRITILLSTK